MKILKYSWIFLIVIGLFIVAGSASASAVDFLHPANVITYDEPIEINSSIKVTKPSYFEAGFHVGQQVVGGVSYLQGTIINTTTNNNIDIPVTVGDNMRIDGVMWRGQNSGPGDNMPFSVLDDFYVEGNIAVQPNRTVDGVDISELRISDWNEAYSWGNHALAGYGVLARNEVIIGNWNNAANPWADNEVAALASGVQGNILYHNGTSWTQLPAGTSGNYLETEGAGSNPEWSTPSSWHGSTSRIKLLPTDFMQKRIVINDGMDKQGRYLNMPNDADGIATIPIPIGYRAIDVYVDCNQSRDVKVYENSINDGITAFSLGGGTANSVIDITDTDSTSANYISIYVDSKTIFPPFDRINGGYITITEIP